VCVLRRFSGDFPAFSGDFPAISRHFLGHLRLLYGFSNRSVAGAEEGQEEQGAQGGLAGNNCGACERRVWLLALSPPPVSGASSRAVLARFLAATRPAAFLCISLHFSAFLCIYFSAFLGSSRRFSAVLGSSGSTLGALKHARNAAEVGRAEGPKYTRGNVHTRALPLLLLLPPPPPLLDYF
jgi:hypothetical protein